MNEVLWLNLTNIGLGVAVLLCGMVLVFAVVRELLPHQRRR